MTPTTDPRTHAVQETLRAQRIEMPSWAFGNSGTRFKVFAQAGVPRDPYEKIEDAATGATLHRRRSDGRAAHPVGPRRRLRQAAASTRSDLGVELGTINANVFQDNDYMLGSVTNPTPAIRRKATDHLLECIDIMDQTGSRDLKLWFSDGTNYPGQDDMRDRQDRLAESLAEVYDATRRRPADAARVQAVRAGVLHDGRARLGHRVRALHAAGDEGAGRRRHRPPRTGHEHRVHRRVAAAGGQARWLRLQLPLLRRRRPDGRRGGPVPAVPDHVRGRRGGGLDAAAASRSCSTSATTSSRRSPARSAR